MGERSLKELRNIAGSRKLRHIWGRLSLLLYNRCRSRKLSLENPDPRVTLVEVSLVPLYLLAECDVLRVTPLVLCHSVLETADRAVRVGQFLGGLDIGNGILEVGDLDVASTDGLGPFLKLLSLLRDSSF